MVGLHLVDVRLTKRNFCKAFNSANKLIVPLRSFIRPLKANLGSIPCVNIGTNIDAGDDVDLSTTGKELLIQTLLEYAPEDEPPVRMRKLKPVSLR